MSCHALIVGVGAYSISDFDLDTPVSNAILMAETACALQLPPKNIHVVLSGAQEADKDALSKLGVNLVESQATCHGVNDVIVNQLAVLNPSELLVFWSGHGILHDDGQRYFLCSDYTPIFNERLFSMRVFRDYLNSTLLGSVETCWFLADVCGSRTDLPVGPPGTVPINQLRNAPNSLYAFATPELAAARSAGGYGVFTALLSDVLTSLKYLPPPKKLVGQIEAKAKDGQPFHFDFDRQEGDQEFRGDRRVLGTPASSGQPRYFDELYINLCKAKLPLSAAEAAYRATYSALGNRNLALRPSGLKEMLSELARTGTDPDRPALWLGVFVAVLKEKLSGNEAVSRNVLQAWETAEIVGDLAELVRRKSRQILLDAAKLLVVEVETRSADHLVEARTTLREEDFRACLEPRTLFAHGVPVATWDDVFDRLVDEIDHLLDADILNFSIHVVLGHGLEAIDLHKRTWLDTETEMTAPLGQEFGVILHYLPRHLRKPTRRWRGDRRSIWMRHCDPLLGEAGATAAEWVNVTHAEQARSANTLALCHVGIPPGASEYADVTRALLDQGAPCIYWQGSDQEGEVPPRLSEDPDRCFLDQMRDRVKRLRASHEAHGPLVWDVMPAHLTLLDGEGEEENQ